MQFAEYELELGYPPADPVLRPNNSKAGLTENKQPATQYLHRKAPTDEQQLPPMPSIGEPSSSTAGPRSGNQARGGRRCPKQCQKCNNNGDRIQELTQLKQAAQQDGEKEKMDVEMRMDLDEVTASMEFADLDPAALEAMVGDMEMEVRIQEVMDNLTNLTVDPKARTVCNCASELGDGQEEEEDEDEDMDMDGGEEDGYETDSDDVEIIC